MLAQRSAQLNVLAIELDVSAALQAEENVKRSIFSKQIKVLNDDFRVFFSSDNMDFDLIITNPPYFHSSYLSCKGSRNMARHSQTLLPEDLFKGSEKLLNKGGRLCIIMPREQEPELVELGEKYGFYPCRKLNVFPRPETDASRVCLDFQTEQCTIQSENLIIESGGRHMYTSEYRALTKDFYLDF